MKKCRLHQFVVAALLLSTIHQPVRAQEPQDQSASGTPIRVQVHRVRMGVTVTDSRGNFIRGLRRKDFQLFDNGAEQPLTGFLATEDPAQVVLLIESGPAAAILGKSHLAAVDGLLNALAPSDRVAVASYSDGPQLLFDFTSDKTVTQAALKQLNSLASLGQLNLASSVVQTLDWLSTMPGKKAIILISSGIDTSSVDWQVVQQRLITSDISVLAISVSGAFPKLPRHEVPAPEQREARAVLKQEFAEADRWLNALCQATGGRAYAPKTPKDFDRAYSEVARFVRGEYSLEFAPASLDGRLHSVTVKVKGSAEHVSHRRAYLAPLHRPQ